MKFVLYNFLLITIIISSCKEKKESILIYAGSASMPATEEFAKYFEKETGIETEIIFGGSGFLLSQMIVSKKGDVYFPGSSDYMEKAKKENLIFPETEKIVCYLVPAINVQKGNPKGIQELKDLIRPNIKVAIANPEGVCLGTFAVEIIENNLNPTEQKAFYNNVINYAGSCSKTATAVSLKTVDAVIGWRVFAYWDSVRIENIPLKKTEIKRLGYIPVAVSKYSKNKAAAEKFINLLGTEEAKRIFEKHNYFTSEEKAIDYIVGSF